MIELSALELHYLIDEMKFLEGARVDKISQPSKEEIFLQFYVRAKGKQKLKIAFPNLIYLTLNKPETPEKMYRFCSALRKYLDSAILQKIHQINSERIVELIFSTKEENYHLIIELFAKGNAVLCRENLDIILPLRNTKWKERELKSGIKYEYPAKEVNFFSITLPEFKSITEKSEKNISKILAVDIGLGGKYAREICESAKINPTSKELTQEEIKEIFNSLKKTINKKSKISSKEIESAAESQKKEKKTRYDKEIERLEKIIIKQEKQIKELESSAEENQKKGETVYEKYAVVKEILEEIRKAREKYSWKEIKEKLKDHKIIKEVDIKKGELVLEI